MEHHESTGEGATLARRGRRRVALVTVMALAGATLTAGAVQLFVNADSAPANPADPATPATVTADALPTVQIDGVVWSQTVVGNTVYVGGSFANARPAGAAPGTNLTPRSNFLAYNLTTGELITTFAPSFNAQVRTVVASADGTRLYVGGDFTSVNGVSRSRIAAFDIATGNLVPFFPSVAYNVHAIVVHPSGSPVYVGGNFNAVGSVQRGQLAAFNAANGALLDWAPQATGGLVKAMAISPDGSKIAVGGQFTTLNGSNNPGFGLGMLDAVTGANLPMAVNATVRNGGNTSGITSLVTDGTDIFGSGYWFGGTGNFEGTFSASWNGGAINWLADCHGDTYSVFPQGGAVYNVGHSHECGGLGDGAYQRANPWNYYRGIAFSRTATSTLARDPYGYFNFQGQPAPSLLNFFPSIDTGTYTGQSQGPWSLSGNSQYLVMGGEFRNVNDAPQQGLVRFAVSSIAPNKQIPRLFLSNWVPRAVSPQSGTVRITWSGNWDRDNENFTYQVFRDNDGTRIATLSGRSNFYEMDQFGYTDTGLTPGSTVRYRVKAIDPFGNEAPSDWVTVTVGSGPNTLYGLDTLADRPLDYWRMGETSGTSTDLASNDPLTINGSVTRNVAGAIAGETDGAMTFSGASSQYAASSTKRWARNTFTVEAWVKTNSSRGGKIIGFGSSATGNSSSFDRHLYIGNDGKLRFGIYPGAQRVITSPSSLVDNQWHYVVGTLAKGVMTLYVDGQQVGQLTDAFMGHRYEGYWRVGGDNLSGWPNRPASDYFNGSIDEAAVYPRALTSAEIAQRYVIGSTGAVPNQPPTAAFTATTSPLQVNVDGSTSTDTDGTIVSYVWDFGDGSVGNGVTASRTYAAAGTYTVKLTVTDNKGATASSTQQVIVPAVPVNQPPTAAFTATTSPLAVAVDGSASTDPDGTIATYAWDFGDGTTGTGATATHTYAAAGTYTVSLTVADNLGAANTATQQVVVPAAPVNQPPTAAFTATPTPLQVAVNGSASSDPDGTIVSYAWDFGDGGTATGVTASRTYAAAGTYTVTLTVTDNLGATNTTTQSVIVPDVPVNGQPTASFTATPTTLAVAVDGSASSDPDGTIVSYAWDFGDGGTATGVTASRTYAAAGTYTVKLTVTDNQGATNTATQSVVVPGPVGPTPFATDAFGRTVATGLGTADTGGAWTLSGSAANFSVGGGTGNLRMSAAGAGVSASLAGTSTDTEVRVSVGIDKPATGGGLYLSTIGRKVGANDYRGRVRILANGQVQAFITTNVGGEVNIASTTVAGLTFNSGDRLNIKFQVTGTSPTTLRLKVWKVGTTEPTAWTLTTTDSNASLQSGGGVGLVTYLSGSATNAPVIASFDDLWAGPTA
ncbi:MAG: PKD domain-containing protein [Acidimicrobiales bacterium]